MIRSATPFPLVSLFFMFIGFVLNNIGHVRPHRSILAFVSGIFFILSGTLTALIPHPLLFLLLCFLSWILFPRLSGLALVVGLVLYISSINDEMLNRTKSSEAYFTYKYGWSFAFAAISFLLTEVRHLKVSWLINAAVIRVEHVSANSPKSICKFKKKNTLHEIKQNSSSPTLITEQQEVVQVDSP